ncbi:MAG TPA: hypothetical protein VND98_02365 [Solirubrobacterales bacterium]|nr:hypothetical protein [Solirubrobacterales bacterium]
MPIPTRPHPRPRPPLARAASALRGRLRWDARPAIGEVTEAARWPFERAAWAIERGLIWPLQRRFGDWDLALRGLTAGAVVATAALAGVAGLLWATAPGTHSAPAPRPAPSRGTVAAKPPARTPAKGSSHLLHGAPPLFSRPAAGRNAAKVANEKTVRVSSTSTRSGNSAKGGGASISSASTIPAKPAPAAALTVARQFSEAFVLYETDQGGARVRAAFAGSATPALEHSLLQRPPRQPATAKVPRATVLNVVAGPSSGSIYTVSVSLLRVGVTSELRLEMEKAKHGKWRVTDVLG